LNYKVQNIKYLILLPALLQAAICFAQKSTFDIVDFTAPVGWVKQEAKDVMIFVKENKQTGGYCVISLFKSDVTNGIDSDFEKAWQNIPVKAYKGPEKPLSKEKADAEDGWSAMSGSARLKIENTDAICLLSVLTNDKRTFSVFAVMNDDSYFTELEKFLEGIDINKEELAKLNNNKETKSDPLKIKESVSTPKAGMQTYENFIYQIPDGWTSKQETKFMELFPQRTREHELFSIILLKGKNSTASLKQELASCWDEFAGIMKAEKLREVNGGNYNEDEISKTFQGWEYIAGHGSIRTGADFFVHTYIIRVKDRVERVIVLSKEIRLDALRSNIDPSLHHYPYYTAITDFIFSLQFANSPSPTLSLPTWKGNNISGVWAGIGFMGGQLKTTYAIFFSNGQVFYGSRFPLQGLYELNTYADKERTKRYWGTYSFQNGKGTVNMPNGSFPIRTEGDKLVMAPVNEEHKFIRMSSVDNVKLNGTWKIEGQNNLIVSITFKPDGTFSDNGALRVLDHTIYNYYSIADGGGSGKYFIKDHTVVFSYSDGRILKIAFPGKQFTPGNNSPKELVLSYNDDLLIKN
jgi:hypothetical protein